MTYVLPMNKSRLAAAALVLAALVPTTSMATAEAAPKSKAPVIYEDDPRWDCRTMGNRTCGAVVLDPVTGAEIPVIIRYYVKGGVRSVTLVK